MSDWVMNITCPKCGYTGDSEPTTIPDDATIAREQRDEAVALVRRLVGFWDEYGQNGMIGLGHEMDAARAFLAKVDKR